MGLDMYLTGSQYVGLYSKSPIEWFNNEVGKLPIKSIRYEVAYWRKANQIHKWFVDNVQNGEDDCKEYYVPREKLEELYKLCKDILSKKVSPEEGLPTQEGFFFGDTGYNAYYKEDLKHTKSVLKEILNNKKYENMEFYYSSSW